MDVRVLVRRFGTAFLAVAFVAIAGCSGGEEVCEPGKQRACPCPGTDNSGTQTCNDQGTAWESCQCSFTDGGAGDADTGGTMDDADDTPEDTSDDPTDTGDPGNDATTDAGGPTDDTSDAGDEPSDTSETGSDDGSSDTDDTGTGDTCTPADEICDGIDNDCDGEVDETCPHRIFVTDKEYDGKRGGISGLDALCNNVADEADLEGNWKAVVSTSSKSARDRITVDGTVYNLSDSVIADNEADMWDGTLDQPVSLNQYGDFPDIPNFADPDVWTATDQQGQQYDLSETCDDWTSNDPSEYARFGFFDTSNDSWVSFDDHNCDADARFYCIDGQSN